MNSHAVRVWFTGAAIAGMLASSAAGQSSQPGPPDHANIRKNFDAQFDRWRDGGFHGLIRICHDGRAIFERTAGWADKNRSREIEPDMVFDLGSITKVFTAAAVLKLKDAGKLSLGDGVGRFVPNLPGDKAAVTLEQLMRHTSGLPDIFGMDEDNVSREWFLGKIREAAFRSAPGTKTAYSNAGYSLLGIAIENTSGTNYERYVQESVLAPAGLRQTGYVEPRWVPQKVVCGFKDGKPWGSVRDYYAPDGPGWNLHANGGMLSTATELDQWFRALEKGRLLTPESTAIIIDALTRKTDNSGRHALSITGSNNIFSAMYLRYRDQDLSMTILTSSSDWPYDRVAKEAVELVEELVPPADPGKPKP